MKSISRQVATLAAGSVAVLCLGLAAFAQTLSASPSKTVYRSPLIQGRYFEDLVPRPKNYIPECCFCGQKTPFFDTWRWKPVSPPADVREIDLEGLKKILQRDPKDTRPLLINFWATWCDPCREEFPDLVKLDADYTAKRLNFVAVSLDDISEIKTAVPQFLKEMKATMPVVLLNVNDPEPAIHAVDEKWDGQLPATFLYDKDGRVVFKYFGRIKPEELRAAIDKTVVKQ